jgi:hypothetical protein
MKTYLILVASLLISITSFSQANYDDVYYSPKTDTSIITTETTVVENNSYIHDVTYRPVSVFYWNNWCAPYYNFWYSPYYPYWFYSGFGWNYSWNNHYYGGYYGNHFNYHRYFGHNIRYYGYRNMRSATIYPKTHSAPVYVYRGHYMTQSRPSNHYYISQPSMQNNGGFHYHGGNGGGYHGGGGSHGGGFHGGRR